MTHTHQARPINLLELLFLKGKKRCFFKVPSSVFLFPLPNEIRHFFFSSLWSVCKIIRNKLVRGEGRVVPTFDFSVLQRGLWGGLWSIFPVASQIFWVLFCQVLIPKGPSSATQSSVFHAYLSDGHLLDWHLPANKGLKEWDQEARFVLQTVVTYLYGDLYAKPSISAL